MRNTTTLNTLYQNNTATNNSILHEFARNTHFRARHTESQDCLVDQFTNLGDSIERAILNYILQSVLRRNIAPTNPFYAVDFSLVCLFQVSTFFVLYQNLYSSLSSFYHWLNQHPSQSTHLQPIDL